LWDVAVAAHASPKARVDVGRALLAQVSHRLTVQQGWLEDLTRRLDPKVPAADRTTLSSLPDNNNAVYRTSAWLTPVWKVAQAQAASHALAQARQGVATLSWIHTDTARDCRTILDLSPEKAAPYLADTLSSVSTRHARTVETLAEVVVALRPHATTLRHGGGGGLDSLNDDAMILPFLHQRLGIQLLCEHYMEVVGKRKKAAGTIDVQRSVQEAVLDAMGEAKILTEAHYEHPPVLEYGGGSRATSERDDDDDLKATWVGPWLHYVLVELLKNATTATVQAHPSTPSESLLPPPPVVITATQDDHTTFIYIDDRGTGVGTSTTTTVQDTFRFAQTEHIWDRMDEQTTYAMVRPPLRGLGVGLSLSAAMMTYFGGALRLEARAGGGTRAVLTIPRYLTILEAAAWEETAVHG
jgi:hypothetical protein